LTITVKSETAIVVHICSDWNTPRSFILVITFHSTQNNTLGGGGQDPPYAFEKCQLKLLFDNWLMPKQVFYFLITEFYPSRNQLFSNCRALKSSKKGVSYLTGFVVANTMHF